MGFVNIRVKIENILNAGARCEVELLVDTGALYSMVPASSLKELGIEPREVLEFELADGRTVERSVGEARFRLNGRSAVSPVIFAEEGDAAVLGVVTLEAMGLEVDPVRKQVRPTRMILY